jgi:hypothetical protein
MKKQLFFFLFFSMSLFTHAQCILDNACNMLRGGDVIIKQQVAYKDPGREGSQVLWDFSKQESVNDNYKLSYTDSGTDSVVVGREHRTLYRYVLRGDSLLLLGYENPTTIVTSGKPELVLIFPFSYGDQREDYFFGTGNYCNKLNVTAQGKVSVNADATGMIILPSGDTLQNVLRVHSIKKIAEKMILTSLDSTLATPTYNPDSIDYHLTSDSARMQVETYRWYANGYRYPIFETVESTVYKNQIPYTHFNTAFFYTPEEHSYIENDPENQAKLEKQSESSGQKTSAANIINYNYYVSSSSNTLFVEYNLSQSAQVSIALYNTQGRLLAACPQATQSAGCYERCFSLEDNSQYEYILRLVVNETTFGEKILKP